MRAADVMTADVVAAGPETSVAEIVRLLLQHRISAVPVIDGAGRLLGMATVQPKAVEVLEDLIAAGQGLEIAQRPVSPGEVGGPVHAAPGELPVAVVRGDERIAFDDERCRSLQPNDVVVSVLRV